MEVKLKAINRAVVPWKKLVQWSCHGRIQCRSLTSSHLLSRQMKIWDLTNNNKSLRLLMTKTTNFPTRTILVETLSTPLETAQSLRKQCRTTRCNYKSVKLWTLLAKKTRISTRTGNSTRCQKWSTSSCLKSRSSKATRRCLAWKKT